MKVLVTGHRGFVGHAMVPTLRARGHEVVGLDVGYFSATGPEVDHEIVKDVRDATSDDVRGIEGIVHLAALSNDPMGELAPELTYAINHEAGIRLAQLGREAGVRRFVFASSCSMYGAAGGDDEVTEDAPLKPLTHYATSKVKSEEDLSKLADSNFSPVFLRNATAYGASPALRADVVVNNLTGFAYHDGEVRIMSDGTPWRPLVHIGDMSLAAACALEAPREAIHNEPFNIAPEGENYQIRDLAKIVADTVPGSEVSIASDASPDARSYRVSFKKSAAGLPGFEPTWNVPKGAVDVRDWFQGAGLGQAWLDRPWVRLKQLRHLSETGAVDSELRFTGS